jgi:hypothetical protein
VPPGGPDLPDAKPLPSSRTDVFYRRFRFESFEAAVRAANAAIAADPLLGLGNDPSQPVITKGHPPCQTFHK